MASEELPQPNKLPLVVVAGPTGSGKSALAIALAQKFQGEIVNYDSLQLYRGFDIGTAKTPFGERHGIPHHLFDVLEPANGYSAGEYARAGRAVLREISGRGRLPILAGGTGFYLKALLEGLPVLPERDQSLRGRLSAREGHKPGALHRLLTRLDPDAAARIHKNDSQKLTRALEIRLTTGAPLPLRETAAPLEDYAPVKIGLNPDRTALNARLDARVEAMFGEGLLHGGLIEEVRELLAKGATGDEKPFDALGYRQALAFIRERLSLEEAIESTQWETRQYAKRQLTWFRRDPEMRWLAGFGDSSWVQADAAETVRLAALPSS
ncbi:MAG TPA: tRNA (adenosine(37)-N6)-dimethylallyltransferase MiaA [Bryobacteraceae bacterium]|nr:tRNA (adenosine(37)-N6)-dimethylallyltransferase MiaA [Bryobacteraceae bacterium]